MILRKWLPGKETPRSYVSAKVLGALGDPRRLENHRQVLKIDGYALYQAVMVASSKNPVFMKYFTVRMAGRQTDRQTEGGSADRDEDTDGGENARHRLDADEEEGDVRSGPYKLN